MAADTGPFYLWGSSQGDQFEEPIDVTDSECISGLLPVSLAPRLKSFPEQ